MTEKEDRVSNLIDMAMGLIALGKAHDLLKEAQHILLEIDDRSLARAALAKDPHP